MSAPVYSQENSGQYTLISIVTPSYNQGSFLARTIESVLNQAGDFRIDYIIMDGGSQDGSVEIIRKFQNLVESGKWQIQCRGITLRWISEKDKGQGDAIRKGFHIARGTILAWLNSDDLYEPGALQSVTDFFRTNTEISILYGDSVYCDETDRIIGRYPADDFDFQRLASFNFMPQPSTFFRKDVYEAVGGLDDSLHYAMDYDLAIRMCKQFSCRYLPQQLSRYRLHEDSKTERDEVLLDNHEEGLRVARKHYSWAPLNLVYGSCNSYCRRKLPAGLRRSPLLMVALSLVCAIFRSIWLNRGIDHRDLQLLNRENFSKLFKNRREILLG